MWTANLVIGPNPDKFQNFKKITVPLQAETLFDLRRKVVEFRKTPSPRILGLMALSVAGTGYSCTLLQDSKVAGSIAYNGRIFDTNGEEIVEAAHA